MKSIHISFELLHFSRFCCSVNSALVNFSVTLPLPLTPCHTHFLSYTLSLDQQPYNWHCMQKYVRTLTVWWILMTWGFWVFFFCFDSAGGGKMVRYHSSGFHLSAQTFISSRIAASNIQCCCLFVFPAKMAILLSAPITHLWSVPTQTNALQIISFPFCSKTVFFSTVYFCLFLHSVIILVELRLAAGHRQKKL